MDIQIKGECVLKIKIALLATVCSLFAADVVDRNTSTSHDIMLGSKPSDIPTGGLVKDFKPMNVDLYKETDISAYPNSKVFAGYGVYDYQSKNCAKVDAATGDGTKADSRFTDFKVYNGHTYAVSINKMTYDQCKAYAANYNGYPVRITTQEENNAIASIFGKHDKWIGATRNGPCPSEYIDSFNKPLRYDGFFKKNAICSDVEANTYMPNGTTFWYPKNVGEFAKCIVEFNTDDWEKPIRSCAPWWSIERSYLLPSQSRYLVTSVDANGNPTQVDIRTFNQKDFPKTLSVCTKINPNDINKTSAGTQTVVCNTYYDRTASPRCLENPEQDVCRVDECRGAIKDRCTFIESSPAPLEYSKEPFFSDGQYRKIKRKVNIEMNKYSCPILAKNSSCLETGKVTMLPQPCPGTDKDENGGDIKPIKVYGHPSVDGPNKYDNDGNLLNLYGKCPDGTIVEVPIDVLKQTSKICAEYELKESTKEYDRLCVVDRSYYDTTALTSLSESDAFMNDPLCVRVNNIAEARPPQDIRVDYQTFGMGSLAIIKAQQDGGDVSRFEKLIPSQYYAMQVSDMSFSSVNQSADVPQKDFDTSNMNLINCSEFDNGTPDPFYSNASSMQDDGVKGVYKYKDGEIVDFGKRTKSDCTNVSSKYGASIIFGANDANQTQINQYDADYESLYTLGSKTGISSKDLLESNATATTIDGCVGVRPVANTIPGDVYGKYIFNNTGIGTSTDISLTSLLSVDYERCREIAYCTNADILNQSKYSGTQYCNLKKTETSGQAVKDEYRAEILAEIDAQSATNGDTTADIAQQRLNAGSQTGVLTLDQIDGVSDIYAVMEYTDFNFGYFSSYSSRNFITDMVKINGQVVMPLVEHPRINEKVREDYRYNYTTYRNYALDSFSKLSLGVDAGGGGKAIAAASFVSGVGELTWLYNAIFGKQVISFTGNSYSEVYGYIDPAIYRYVENPYGYETRKVYQKSGEALQRVEYFDISYGTSSKQEKSQAGRYFGDWQKKKKALYEELNIDMVSYQWPYMDTASVLIDPDGCKWYNPWCKKTRNMAGSGTLDTTKYHTRKVSVNYMGATNTVSIVVPYKGDYIVQAYNAVGDKLSEVAISESMFMTSNTPHGTSMQYAQVKLGEAMPISPMVQNDPCVSDLMVEVGGGVSGAYYELGETGQSHNFQCGKSDDAFVVENSIMMLKILPVSQDKPFTLHLKKPLPYPNRVFITTLGYSEERIYRCYDSDYPECTNYTKAAE